MTARNHVTPIMSSDPVAKASEKEVQKVNAELNVPDPNNAEEALKANTVYDTDEKNTAKSGEDSDVKQKEVSEKEKDSPTENHLKVTNPKPQTAKKEKK